MDGKIWKIATQYIAPGSKQTELQRSGGLLRLFFGTNAHPKAGHSTRQRIARVKPLTAFSITHRLILLHTLMYSMYCLQAYRYIPLETTVLLQALVLTERGQKIMTNESE